MPIRISFTVLKAKDRHPPVYKYPFTINKGGGIPVHKEGNFYGTATIELEKKKKQVQMS